MIDIHCHILPSVDDGPHMLEESLRMGKLAMEEGVTSIVATPHAFHPQFDSNNEWIKQKYLEVCAGFQEEGILIDLYLGQEIRVSGELTTLLLNAKAMTIANSRYVLIEFQSDSVPAYVNQLLFNLQLEGYVPIIAHPERNKEFAREPGRLFELVNAGALSQITTSSVTGDFGRHVQELALTFLRNGLSQLIASDAHNTDCRSFNWTRTKEQIVDELGESMWEMYRKNAKAIIQNEPLQLPKPVLPVKNWRGKWKK